MNPKLILPFYLKLGMVLLSIIALFYIAIIGKTILAPLIFAFMSAILLLPVAAWLETKLKFHRSLAAICAVLLRGLNSCEKNLPVKSVIPPVSSRNCRNLVGKRIVKSLHHQHCCSFYLPLPERGQRLIRLLKWKNPRIGLYRDLRRQRQKIMTIPAC